MGAYLTRWQNLKQAFETEAQKKRPLETTKTLLGTAAKSSGVTPILKDIETALAKKERKPLEQALNKLNVARSSYGKFLSLEQAKFQDDPVVWKAYHSLIIGLQDIEVDLAAAAKSLQEAKSSDQKGIEFFGLEGDLKGALVAAKAKLAPFATLEKKYGLLKKADATVKAAETYTKAAARTQAKEARVALELFKVECKKCADELDKVLKLEKEAKFHAALQSYHDAMKNLAVVQRIDGQIAKLKAMEAGA
jgi:hypothetical protein